MHFKHLEISSAIKSSRCSTRNLLSKQATTLATFRKIECVLALILEERVKDKTTPLIEVLAHASFHALFIAELIPPQNTEEMQLT